MGLRKQLLNYTLTALLAGVGFSTPLYADEARVDQLFEQLRAAPPEEVDRLQNRILDEWRRSGSPAMDLLLRRGEDALEEGDAARAVEHFSALVDHAPTFAEGYNGRAAAFYQLELYGPAIDDLRQVLVLEPRHFGALTGVAVVLEELDRFDDALEVWQQIASYAPADPEVLAVIERLENRLQGQSL
ncbi:hypothetical protein [Thalassorhabdomicrobium marinisediminis]|uniref:Uncharacterized protein n=1 Tax=Thalassorhabdomicrobium marinisediminis TaxID=2170577 RepID=A0A2T7FY64_9RHOB|nr:hypothetical protein [Thalassorhabdomicrobium marinisediminis]PVA07109.1 hypothetical protein DC363_07045 [Thalassorhabdomicrobium marinisediminis]